MADRTWLADPCLHPQEAPQTREEPRLALALLSESCSPTLPGLGSQEQQGRPGSLNPETGVAKNEGKVTDLSARGRCSAHTHLLPTPAPGARQAAALLCLRVKVRPRGRCCSDVALLSARWRYTLPRGLSDQCHWVHLQGFPGLLVQTLIPKRPCLAGDGSL